MTCSWWMSRAGGWAVGGCPRVWMGLPGSMSWPAGTRMIRASEKIRAVGADSVVAELLGVAMGSPLLSVERVSYTYGDRPVEVRRGWYVTDGYYYQNDLS